MGRGSRGEEVRERKAHPWTVERRCTDGWMTRHVRAARGEGAREGGRGGGEGQEGRAKEERGRVSEEGALGPECAFVEGEGREGALGLECAFVEGVWPWMACSHGRGARRGVVPAFALVEACAPEGARSQFWNRARGGRAQTLTTRSACCACVCVRCCSGKDVVDHEVHVRHLRQHVPGSCRGAVCPHPPTFTPH